VRQSPNNSESNTLTLVYINTLMIQQILAEPTWANRLNAADLRGITPLVYGHVKPYGSFHLDLHSRLPIDPPCVGPESVGTQMLLSYDHSLHELLCGWRHQCWL
jgi:hypothetical protein